MGVIFLAGILIWSCYFGSPEEGDKEAEAVVSFEIDEDGDVISGAGVDSEYAQEQNPQEETQKSEEDGSSKDEKTKTTTVKKEKNSGTKKKTTKTSTKKNSKNAAEKNSDNKTSSNQGSETKKEESTSADNSQQTSTNQNTEEKNTTYQSTVGGLTITSEDATCNVSGNVATITKAGTYTMTGTLSEGQIIINTEKTSKIVIVCNKMSIACSNASPFYVKSADEIIFRLAAGTTNTISDGASYANVNGPNAALYSEEDITIEGSGNLKVTGKYADGIASKNDIYIKQGTLQVEAMDDGIRGKDGIEISGGTVNIVSESHALKTTETTDTSKGMVQISGGTVTMDATGDGIHATNQIKVSGGNTYIDAKNEGLDSDSSFVMTGGTLVIDGPKSLNHKIIDCTKGATIHGGTFFGVGSNTMTSGFGSGSGQKSLFYKAISEQQTDTTVKIYNPSGTEIYSHKVTRKYQCVMYSAPNLSAGNYTVYCNATKLGTCNVG